MGFADNREIPLAILICCSTIVAVIGLILGAVSLSQNGTVEYAINVQTPESGSSVADSSDKTWLIGIGHYDANVEYLDTVSYTIRGYNVDIVDAVCDIANKNCELVWDIYENCWDTTAGQRARGGPGLMGGWYDACTGWVQTYDRLLTYGFTKPFDKGTPVALYAKRGAQPPVDPNNLSQKRVGFLDGWSTDEHCLRRYLTGQFVITGADLPQENIKHYQTPDALIVALNDGLVDAGFAWKLPKLETELENISGGNFPNHCEVAGGSMMTTKRNTEFIHWWDDAFTRLVGTRRYEMICEGIDNAHGHIAGRSQADICFGQ